MHMYVCVSVHVCVYFIHTHMRGCDGVCGNETVFVFTVFCVLRVGGDLRHHSIQCVCVSQHIATTHPHRDVTGTCTAYRCLGGVQYKAD